MTHEHFRKSLLAGALSLVFAVGLPLAAQAAGTNASSTQTQTSSLSSTDHKFIEDAARGGVGEVQLGQLAAQKAQSDEVKQFGQRMVSDHSKANDKLKQVATQKNINLPTEMDSSSKREYDKLPHNPSSFQLVVHGFAPFRWCATSSRRWSRTKIRPNWLSVTSPVSLTKKFDVIRPSAPANWPSPPSTLRTTLPCRRCGSGEDPSLPRPTL